MKKFFLAVILAVFFVSCGTDDDSNSINATNITGKWFLKGGTINGGTFENYEHECSNSKDYQEFLDNGTLNFASYNSDCEISDTDSSQWELNGNILTVSNQNMDPMIYSYEYTVEAITSDELRLRQSVQTPEGQQTQVIYFTRS